MCIDLDDGWIDMQGPGEGNKTVVHLDTRGTVGSTHHPYFNIKSQAGRNMMMISPNEYYLQTDGYQVETTSNGVTTPGKGIQLDLKNSKLTGYDFHLKAIESSGTYQGSYVKIDSGGEPYFQIKYKKAATTGGTAEQNASRDKNLIYIGNDDFYIQSQTYNASDETGTKINLKDGGITSYEFSLKAGPTDQRIMLDSTVPKKNSNGSAGIPFYIGNTSNFSVTWGGKLTCNGADINSAAIDSAKITSGTINNATITNGSISNATVDKLILNGKTIVEKDIDIVTNVSVECKKSSGKNVVTNITAGSKDGSGIQGWISGKLLTSLTVYRAELYYLYYLKVVQTKASLKTLGWGYTPTDDKVVEVTADQSWNPIGEDVL
jgi:hypothetical protein